MTRDIQTAVSMCVWEAVSQYGDSMLESPWREICEEAVTSLCYVVSLFALEWSHLIFPLS
jgi:hypothetical protein